MSEENNEDVQINMDKFTAHKGDMQEISPEEIEHRSSLYYVFFNEDGTVKKNESE